MDTARESALEADSEKNPLLQRGLEPTSVLHLGFQLDALPTELSLSHVSDLNQIRDVTTN